MASPVEAGAVVGNGSLVVRYVQQAASSATRGQVRELDSTPREPVCQVHGRAALFTLFVGGIATLNQPEPTGVVLCGQKGRARAIAIPGA